MNDEVAALVRATFDQVHPERGGEVFPPDPSYPKNLPNWYGDTIYVLDTVEFGGNTFRLRDDVLPLERGKFTLVSMAWMQRRADWRYTPVRHMAFYEVIIAADRAEAWFSEFLKVYPSDQHWIVGYCSQAAVFVRTAGSGWQFSEIEQGACIAAGPKMLRTIVCFVALIAVGESPVAAQGVPGCKVPRHKVRQEFDLVLIGGKLIDLSVRPGDPTTDKLLCLARHVVTRHPEWRLVEIFDVAWAAAMFDGVWPMWLPSETHGFTWDQVLPLKRAELDRDWDSGGSPRLTITPFGNEWWTWQRRPEENASRGIETPQPTWYPTQEVSSQISIASGDWARRVAMFGRTLLVATPFRYPREPFTTGAKLTLTATLGKDGRVRGVQAQTPADRSATPSSAWAQEAVRHLGSLRFDPARAARSLRVTYEFETTPPVPAPYLMDVQLAFPDRVVVRVNDRGTPPLH